MYFNASFYAHIPLSHLTTKLVWEAAALFLQLLEDHAVWIEDLFELSSNFDAPLLYEAYRTS
jgi:hypothetical protein